MTFGDKIKESRIDKGLTQEKLADIMGVSRQSISKWELNINFPQIKKMILLCDFLDLPLNEIITNRVES